MTVTKIIINGEEHDFGSNGDMMYSHFNRETVTGNNISLHLNTYYEPSGNFTVNAPVDIKEGQTYILRVNNGATAYVMSLGTGITNLQGTNIELTPNAVDMFVFLATKDGNESLRLELQKEINQSGGGIYYFFLNDETDQTELDNLWDWYNTLPDDPNEFENSVIIIEYGNGSGQYSNYSPSGRYYYKSQDSQDMYFFCDNYTLKVQFEMEGWYTKTGVYSVTISTNYTAGTGISISNNEISSTVQGVPSGGTTGQVLTMTNGGIAWQNAVEGNTKTFYPSSISDLTTAQEILDYFLMGNNPIIVFDNYTFVLSRETGNTIAFTNIRQTISTANVGVNAGGLMYDDIIIYYNGTVVSSINRTHSGTSNLLVTGVDYATPYTPEYDGSPATKKYVDDSVAGSVKYEDFETATVVGATLTISHFTTQIIPSADFTLVAGTIKEGMQYIVRVYNSGPIAYTMSLGTGVTNPFGEDLTLTASTTTTIVLLATSSISLEIFSVRTANYI